MPVEVEEGKVVGEWASSDDDSLSESLFLFTAIVGVIAVVTSVSLE